MYFDWQYYWRVVRSVWSFKNWPRQKITLIKLIVWIPLMTVFNTLCFMLDYVFFPTLWRQKVVKPIFIVGHARSGTTLIHRMMAADTERFSYFLYWETLFPSLLQKRAIRWFGSLDTTYLNGFFDRKLKAWDEKTFGKFRHIHNMSLWNSEEDQFVMRGSFVTQQWSLDMPLFEHIDIFHIDNLPERKRRRWMHHYKECVKRQLLLNGGHKTHLSKNPLFSGWVKAILDTFPDARIVVAIRNPMECIPSVLKLLETNWRSQGWHRDAYKNALQHMADISIESFQLPKTALDARPQTPHIFVDYSKLTQLPSATLSTIYEALKLPISPDYQTYLHRQEQRETQHQSRFNYQLSDYAITPERIEDELGDWFETYQWPLSARSKLRRAWDTMIDALNAGRDAIDTPDLMPPPASDRILSEGYRYLLGFAHAAIERAFHEDRENPELRNMLSPITRATIDNADAIYFYAPIDGSQSYWLRGKIGEAGLLPPHYFIFEATWDDLSGDTGKLSELQPGMRTQTDRLDNSDITINRDGSIEILLAPKRPEGYEGNFICTLKTVTRPHPQDPNIPAQRYASYLSGRQLFGDWEREGAIHFQLELTTQKLSERPHYCVERAVEELKRCGELTRNQMLFWNAFWTIPMGTYGSRKGSLPGVTFPRNAFNQINAASGSTGGGMSTNLYAGGVFEIAPDQALIVEIHVPTPPQYMGFQLANLWGESIDYANRLGSLNRHQMHCDDDGVYRLVVAHRDPGINNWLDTTGHNEGFMAPRWAYSNTPDKNAWPAINATLISLDDLDKYLAPGTPKLTPEQRLQQISVRRQHVKRRFRNF